jgi:hypothetical protein
MTLASAVSLILLYLGMAIVLFGVRARVHGGGGRKAGLCIRRVSVRRQVGGSEERNPKLW